MGISNTQTLYQASVCRFSLSDTDPLASHMFRFRMHLPGKSSYKAQPLLLHHLKHTPARATGLEYFQIFFQKLQLQSAPLTNATKPWWEAYWTNFSITVFLPVLSYPLYSFPCTSLFYIPFLLSCSLSPHLVTSFTRSALFTTNWKNTAVFREKQLTHNRLLCQTPQQQMHKKDAGICEIYKNIEGNKWARSKRNSSFCKYPAGFIQSLSSISLLHIMSTLSEYWCRFTNLCCKKILGHILQAGQKLSFT